MRRKCGPRREVAACATWQRRGTSSKTPRWVWVRAGGDPSTTYGRRLASATLRLGCLPLSLLRMKAMTSSSRRAVRLATVCEGAPSGASSSNHAQRSALLVALCVCVCSREHARVSTLVMGGAFAPRVAWTSPSSRGSRRPPLCRGQACPCGRIGRASATSSLGSRTRARTALSVHRVWSSTSWVLLFWWLSFGM